MYTSKPQSGAPPPYGSSQPPSQWNPPPNNSQSLSSSQSSSKLTTDSAVKLYNNNREREMYDNMADLFSIIKTTEALEKAYVRDAITAEEYKLNCAKLITQFRAAQNLTKDSVPDIKRFMQEYRLDCKAAAKRLIDEGIPLVVPKPDDSARTIAETVQFFITAMDSLKLNMTAVDQIHPLLTDLYESLCKIVNLAGDWEGKTKIQAWLVIMNKMKASDQLSEEQIRQMSFDLESAYNKFHKSLSH
eukprot:TRINITY_DN2059_c0_g2_i2.p1 TRINITY_DN2059_c0_g2~~TRINITY_DN2059_c0_g2_i2.p1  ORF type:complete len:245 (+),score=61.89 TRINITY_DN2059_c0_g2_i2:143-877(+)